MVGLARRLELFALRELCLAFAGGRYTLEKTDRPRFAVDHYFKVSAAQTVNKLSFLIDDCDCRLDQLGVEAHHVVRLRLLRECRMNRSRQEQTGCRETPKPDDA